MKREVLAEFLGSMLLATAVIGSGVMAERLAGGNAAVALLGNTWATVTVLGVLIAAFAPISGAHFNPVVTLVALSQKKIRATKASYFLVAQVVGCCLGTILAHGMFEVPLVQVSTHVREGLAQAMAEVVATAGLILIAFTSPSAKEAAWRIPAWIAGAYWFTSSTSFANPAITLARSLTDSFSGIRPADVPGFIVAQFAGAIVGVVLWRALAEPTASVVEK